MITQNKLMEYAYYDDNTGQLIRRSDGNAMGNHAARLNTTYLQTSIYGSKHYIHRLVYLYKTGEMPNGVIDHIDGDGLNNKWENLRCVKQKINSRNAKRCKRNKSGFTGVHWSKEYKKWIAQISVDGKAIALGSFVNYIDAVSARIKANKEHSFHKNHGLR